MPGSFETYMESKTVRILWGNMRLLLHEVNASVVAKHYKLSNKP